MSLRKETIKLARRNPKLRKYLVPILKQAAEEEEAEEEKTDKEAMLYRETVKLARRNRDLRPYLVPLLKKAKEEKEEKEEGNNEIQEKVKEVIDKIKRENAEKKSGKSKKEAFSLREATIKLARQKPSLQKYLIPLLRQASPVIYALVSDDGALFAASDNRSVRWWDKPDHGSVYAVSGLSPQDAMRALNMGTRDQWYSDGYEAWGDIRRKARRLVEIDSW